MSSPSPTTVFRVWSLYQALGFIFGWFFHSVISHLWTGDHLMTLTPAQLLMHNVSLAGCVLITLFFQHRATTRLFNLNLLRYGYLYLFGPTALFWIGFYLVGVPADILLWFLAVGLLNGLLISKALKIRGWLLWSFLSGFVGFLVGALVLYPLDPYLSSLRGLIAHVIMFTLLGIVAGIPAALFSGAMLRRALLTNPLPPAAVPADLP